jgi:hypothetical protein
MDYYILDGHTPRPVADWLEWARWFGQKTDRRRVAWTEFPGGHVSTVFLGLDHQWGNGPPLLFETMIFGGPHDQYQDRYSTWADAEVGHAAAVALATTEKTDNEEFSGAQGHDGEQ